MITLGLDTTAKTVTAALLSDGEPLSFFSSEAKTTHSASLLPAIRTLLSAASLAPEDVGLFAVSAGPGSFTGVRIGVATVKGLAFGREVPCVGVSSLAALAENASLRRQLTEATGEDWQRETARKDYGYVYPGEVIYDPVYK